MWHVRLSRLLLSDRFLSLFFVATVSSPRLVLPSEQLGRRAYGQRSVTAATCQLFAEALAPQMTSKSQKNSDLRKRKAAAIETDTSSADVTLQHERDDASGKRKVAEQIQGDTRVEYQRDWFDDVTVGRVTFDVFGYEV